MGVDIALFDGGRTKNRAVIVFAAIVTVLPSAILGVAFRPIPAALLWLGCCGVVGIAMRRPGGIDPCLDASVQWRPLVLCVLLAFGLLLLGGETHVFFATADWVVRDAVLADLVEPGFPVVYRIDGADYLLRAPLGMYMLPAAIGRWFGLVAAHGALLCQNAFSLGTAFYMFVVLGSGWRRLAIMVAFAGLVIVPDLFKFAVTHTTFSLTTVLDAWNPYWQYSSSMVHFFWAPNHAIPGWWLAVLFLLNRRGAIDVGTVGVFASALALWSPLAVVPVGPWLLYQAAVGRQAVLLSSRTWCSIGIAVCFAPMIIYLVIGAAMITHGGAAGMPDFTFWYVLFIVVQLPTLLFAAFFWRRIPRDLLAPLVISALILLALPFFVFGPSNDLVRRGSIAPLSILAFIFGGIVVDLVKDRSWGAIVGIALIAASLPSAFGEVSRAILLPRSAVSRCSLIDLIEASRTPGNAGVPANYVALKDAVPTWLLRADATPLVADPNRVCAVTPKTK